MQRLVKGLIIGYAACIALLFMMMEFIGERWWPIAILLYLPQQIFLLPLIVLIPAALLAEVSLGAYATLGGVVIIFLWHVPFYIGMGGSSGPSGPLKIKIMTNNYGQNHGLPLEPFIGAEDPDFVALDDATGQAAAFQRAYPERTVRQVGQFVFISKAPVKAAASLEWPLWRGNPVAAVFDVPWQGQDLAIYAVHLPTPRGDFAKLTGLGLIRELLGRNRRRSDNMSFGEAMTARVELGRDLATVFARESRPFVAAGDFNMPQEGYVHRVVSWGLLDCFQQAGYGFGFTFPGDTHNPLTFGEPWLRIDYVLGGPGWHAGECRVEPNRRSQHRAVVATLSRN
jgi:endonuclease/exonuclease/phosphatase family metal-dependent hydrolase